MSQSAEKLSADLLEQGVSWRRELHAHPQLAYDETFASTLIKAKLDEWGVPYIDKLGTTGLVATLEGKTNTSGKAIGLRADMDALPMHEKTNLPHASKNEGCMHACGHDGHTAILLTALKHLKDNPDFDGQVHFIFQPAEEGAKGAHAMIKDGLFEKVQIDMVFGLHNWPYMPKGQMATRVGPIMAAADKLNITIRGKGGHAAWPHECIDPVVAGSQLIQAIQMIAARNTNPLEAAVISVTQFHSGSGAFNVIPDSADLKGTIRTFTPETRDLVHARLKEVCEGVAKATSTEIECEILLGTDATINSADGVACAVKAGSTVFGANNVNGDIAPVMGAEDFGAFLQHKPGAFVFMGQAESDPQSAHNHSLHSPHYDFNDGIIEGAVAYFTELVKTTLPAT